MKNTRLYSVNAADIIIAVLVAALSMAPLISFARASASTAVIYENGKIAASLDLSKDAVIKIKNMEVETSKGRVRIKSSDCPRQICSHTGWIKSPAQTIVCVPNKVLVEIPGGSGQYDAVSY
jgi:hypothetical protein